jgi:hypothetical protein
MRALSPDTSPDAQRILVERWRTMSPAEKAQIVTLLARDCERLALAGIRSQRPGLDARGERLLLAVRRLGRDLAMRAYGADLLSEPRG